MGRLGAIAQETTGTVGALGDDLEPRMVEQLATAERPNQSPSISASLVPARSSARDWA